jgi:hypothetical protein
VARVGWLAEVLAKQLQGSSLGEALVSAPGKLPFFHVILKTVLNRNFAVVHILSPLQNENFHFLNAPK